MTLYYDAVPPPPLTSPAPDVSRSKLKQMTRWIRDGLDVLVAREGPDSLRPDDVLALHELFVALRQSTTITASDLRATGIHKAVKDIAGIATRWPSRLCDDCDKIITVWTKRFGPLEGLHPFLFGRGGRLEGISTIAETDREALLKRWSRNCPDKIKPSVSHRQGSLGFTAGDWWIGPLFAHHAGIIGLESVDGGTTYDIDGAYALVLKEASEIGARNDDGFTYRCPISDKGRFRLTAATARSRGPIRVLRNHGVNSTWGPKAGIRYEGLYLVKGWCIRQANTSDILSGQWKEGDILYEVTFQRNDPIPMDEVTRRPTSMELDDYAEYKRLRKLQRADKHKLPGSWLAPPKMAPTMRSAQLTASTAVTPKSVPHFSSSVSRKTTFDFDAPSPTQDLGKSLTDSPKAIPDPQASVFIPGGVDTQGMPTKKNKHDLATSSSDVLINTVLSQGQDLGSPPSCTRSTLEDLKEILPWIEQDTDPSIHFFPTTAEVLRQQSAITAVDRLEDKAAALNPVKGARKLARDPGQRRNLSLQSQIAKDQDLAANNLDSHHHTAKTIFGKKEKEEERHRDRSMFGQRPNLLDGVEYTSDEQDADDCTSSRFAWAEATPQLKSPTPIRPPRPTNLCIYGIEDIEFQSPLNDVVSRPRMASPINSFRSTPPSYVNSSRVAGESIALERLRRWLSK
ncbi:hypothetical protein OPT61_g6984 [Boeremia exigua]|uniref:Uncharacterized protein n=1 Tax=Boeremia exigua TaxID=749465 RepID=A0ACC2I517_9PLEO|nr:hypothetical protein OPT61_g6984 [Boeremia exigua]